jgi:hypothetical protein
MKAVARIGNKICHEILMCCGGDWWWWQDEEEDCAEICGVKSIFTHTQPRSAETRENFDAFHLFTFNLLRK